MDTQPTIDVVVCSDRHQFVGVLALICSAARNTGQPRRLSFHLITGEGESGELLLSMRQAFPDPPFAYEIREFRPTPALERYIRVAEGGLCNVPFRSAAINCSRFYLCEVYPELDKVLYLDADVIVQGDLAELDRQATLERHDLAAVPRDFWGLFRVEAPELREIDFGPPGFNAGVFVTRLRKWVDRDVVAQIEAWMATWADVRETSGEDLFYFGSQAILNLIFRPAIQWLPKKWNVCYLGYKDEIPKPDLDSAGILHWSCSRKPWKPEGRYKEYWETYDMRARHARG